jgi:hypothetical protein
MQGVKLFSIQKEVGFTFEEPDNAIINQLVEHESSDRGKKLEWERKNCNQ